MQPIIWSHSSFKMFSQCRRQYNLVKRLKVVKPQMFEANSYGDQAHKAIENYLRSGVPLPEEFKRFQFWVDVAAALSGEKLIEAKLGMTVDGKPTGFFDKNVWWRGLPDFACINESRGVAHVVDWKGLALDTKLATPNGFTTMGEIQVGEQVFDAAGIACKVIGKSEVKNIRCFRVVFDDKTEVICDENHLWKLIDGTTLNVQRLAAPQGRGQKARKAKVPTAKPIRTAPADLPIHPYVLGLWIADGVLASGEIGKPDGFVWTKIQALGYEVNMQANGGNPDCPTRTVKGIRKHLNSLGLLGVAKRIPRAYLRASYAQRVDLLQGLMDGDGNANPTRKQAVYTTTSKDLSEDVCELLASLGQRPNQSEVTAKGFGKTVSAFPVAFRPIGLNPFSLPRKADRILPEWGAGRSWYRHAILVEEVPSVPTQCIAVDSPDHTFLCTERMIPTHNTGKSAKYADKDQLELLALAIFAKYPKINKVKGLLAFMVSNEPVVQTYYRRNFAEMLSKWIGRIDEIRKAEENDVWNPTRSGLCNPYCPATKEHCEFKE